MTSDSQLPGQSEAKERSEVGARSRSEDPKTDARRRAARDASRSGAPNPDAAQDPDAAQNPDASQGSCPESAKESSVDHSQLNPEQLIARHQHGVWRYLRMLGCDTATADDLTQETFLRVLRRKSFVQHSDAATNSYLRRTAYNLLVSQHRKQGRVQTVVEPAILDEVWDRWAGKDLTGDRAVEALKNCFGMLTDRAQKALRMRFADQASRIDIGKALNISDHGARNLMQRAKHQLRQCVEAKLQQPDE